MRALVLAIGALALSNCAEQYPLSTQLAEREAMAELPSSSTFAQRDPVAFRFKIGGSKLPLIADDAAQLEFTTFRCDRPKRGFIAELYFAVGPLRVGEKPPGSLEEVAKLRLYAARAGSKGSLDFVALVPRRTVDGEGYDCARLESAGWRRTLWAEFRMEPPSMKELRNLGLELDFVERPQGTPPAEFAHQLLARERKPVRGGPAVAGYHDPNSSIVSILGTFSPGEDVEIYFDLEGDATRPGSMCRIQSTGDNRETVSYQLYRLCAAGIRKLDDQRESANGGLRNP